MKITVDLEAHLLSDGEVYRRLMMWVMENVTEDRDFLRTAYEMIKFARDMGFE